MKEVLGGGGGGGGGSQLEHTFLMESFHSYKT